MAEHRLYTMSFARVYPLYVAKAERKGRSKEEVDQVICWLTGYSQRAMEAQLEKGTDLATFFAEAPAMNPSRSLITGTICGIRVEQIEADIGAGQCRGDVEAGGRGHGQPVDIGEGVIQVLARRDAESFL